MKTQVPEIFHALLIIFFTFSVSVVSSWADSYANPTQEKYLVSEREYNQDRPKDQLFDEAVQILGGTRIPVLRWYQSINLAVVGTRDPSLNAVIKSIFNDISLLTGIRYRTLSHSLVDPLDYIRALKNTPAYNLSICDSYQTAYCTNFVVIISDRETMHQIAKEFPLRQVYQQATSDKPNSTVQTELTCFFAPGISFSTEIVQSVVYVQDNIGTDLQQTCLQEEIYQSFGLLGDYSNSAYFSFNNQVKPKAITAFDKRLLSSLYDKTFARGTEAVPVARQLSEYCRSRC